MSKTFKDIPEHVLHLQAVRDGKIHHNHSEPKHYKIVQVNENLSKIFNKSNQKIISKHRQKLEDLGKFFTEEEIPSQSFPPCECKKCSNCLKNISGTILPKRIKFEVKETVEKVFETSFCTDYEHYDPLTHKDTRDGLQARCIPTYRDAHGISYHCHCDECREAHPAKNRHTIKQHLHNALLEANSGGIDEAFADPILDTVYSKH